VGVRFFRGGEKLIKLKTILLFFFVEGLGCCEAKCTFCPSASPYIFPSLIVRGAHIPSFPWTNDFQVYIT
jgi:hypothetical protein